MIKAVINELLSHKVFQPLWRCGFRLLTALSYPDHASTLDQ